MCSVLLAITRRSAQSWEGDKSGASEAAAGGYSHPEKPWGRFTGDGHKQVSVWLRGIWATQLSETEERRKQSTFWGASGSLRQDQDCVLWLHRRAQAASSGPYKLLQENSIAAWEVWGRVDATGQQPQLTSPPGYS